MTTDTEKRTLAKRKLELTAPVTPKPYGPDGAKTLWKFGAIDRSLPEDHARAGKAIGFTTFSVSLKDHLEGLTQGAIFVGDYEVKPRPDSDYGPDITLIQIWADGKPVHQKGGGGGRGGYGRSLADDLALEAVKRRSIEAQTAVIQVGEMMRSEHPSMADLSPPDAFRIQGKFWNIVERMLDNYLNGSGPAPTGQKAPQTQPEGRQRAPASKATPSDPTPQPAASDTADEPVKNVGDLLTRAHNLKPPMTPQQVLDALQIGAFDGIEDLNRAWAEVLVVHGSGARGESSEEAFERLGRKRKVTP